MAVAILILIIAVPLALFFMLLPFLIAVGAMLSDVSSTGKTERTDADQIREIRNATNWSGCATLPLLVVFPLIGAAIGADCGSTWSGFWGGVILFGVMAFWLSRPNSKRP